MKTKLLFFLILFINVYSQDEAEKYKYIFHENILEDEKVLLNCIDIINEEAKLNSELIYYRVVLLNELYGYRNTNKETNGFVEYNIAKSNYYELRNQWINNQLSILKEKHSGDRFYNRAESFFEDLLINSNKTQDSIRKDIDTNLLNFYNMFYYSNGAINKYENTVNYYKKFRSFLNGIKNELEILEELVNTDKNIDGIDVYDFIENNLTQIIQLNQDKDYSALLLRYKKNKYKINRLDHFGIGLNFRTTLIERYKDIELANEYFDQNLTIGKLNIQEKYSIEVNYKYFLKNEIDLFSYLDFSFFYVKVGSQYNIFDDEDRYVRLEKYSIPRMKIFEFLDMKNIVGEGKAGKKYGVNIMFPIFVFLPQIIFELGMTLTYQNYSYTTSSTFDYRRIKSYYRADGYFDYSEELESRKGVYQEKNYEYNVLKILPIVGIQLNNILDHFEMRVVTGYNAITYGIRFTI